MGKYIKKPVEIEAFLYDGDLMDNEGNYYVPKWALNAFDDEVLVFSSFEEPGALYVNTLEGHMKVNVGDYIIKGVQNELYPCKPDIFEQTYAKAGEPQLLYTRWVPDEVVKIYDEAGLVEELKGVSKEHLRKYYAYAVSAYELNVDYEDTDDRPDVNIKTLWEKANQNNKI